MALIVNSYSSHVTARLLDFFGRATRWQRALWGAGLVLTLREVLEASEAVRASVLSQDALNYLLDQARALARLDPGVGGKVQLKSLQKALAGEVGFEGNEFRMLGQLVDDIAPAYLEAWSVALGAGGGGPLPGAERAARAIASHLLDSGLHPNYLHRWLSYRVTHDPKPSSLAEIVADAAALVCEPERTFRVVVAFAAAADPPPGAGWLTAPELASWLGTRADDQKGFRQHGGARLEIQARDPWSAAEDAGDRIDRVAARIAIGTRGARLVAHPDAWVEGEKGTFALRSPRRVEVRALEREQKLGGMDQNDIVDAAIELLGALDTGPAGPAVASGWAAVEAVLTMPGDKGKVAAADRLASLVACSWPRAELTTLAHKHAAGATDALQVAIRGCVENRERARLVAEAIAAGAPLTLAGGSDEAAGARMKSFLGDRHRTLLDVQQHATAAIRRLYRQRNLVLHGGKVGAVALRASLRTAAPLVGAGFDRIVHAWYVDGVDPRDLAARARIRIDGADDVARSPVDLLEA